MKIKMIMKNEKKRNENEKEKENHLFSLHPNYVSSEEGRSQGKREKNNKKRREDKNQNEMKNEQEENENKNENFFISLIRADLSLSLDLPTALFYARR